uniref:Uncharacterized protein n=1 Tax=Oryza punctata TaxID=4537 RepID=A0A0E0K943_ORYPU
MEHTSRILHQGVLLGVRFGSIFSDRFIPDEPEDGDPILLICRYCREVWMEHTSRILHQGVLLGVRFGSIFSDRSIVCRRHVRHMLDRVDINHLNIVSMMPRMRVQGCILRELLIIAVLDSLLVEVLLLWIGLLMIFTVTTRIVVLLVFHWMKLLGKLGYHPLFLLGVSSYE